MAVTLNAALHLTLRLQGAGQNAFLRAARGTCRYLMDLCTSRRVSFVCLSPCFWNPEVILLVMWSAWCLFRAHVPHFCPDAVSVLLLPQVDDLVTMYLFWGEVLCNCWEQHKMGKTWIYKHLTVWIRPGSSGVPLWRLSHLNAGLSPWERNGSNVVNEHRAVKLVVGSEAATRHVLSILYTRVWGQAAVSKPNLIRGTFSQGLCTAGCASMLSCFHSR